MLSMIAYGFERCGALGERVMDPRLRGDDDYAAAGQVEARWDLKPDPVMVE
jgi:hypothetical protein